MKKIIWLVVFVVVLGAVWFMASKNKAEAPTDEAKQVSVDAELDGLSDTDLEAEFSEIDADAAQL